jgi:hypothetical protein
LDKSYEYDLAIAVGDELRVIYGRDRKLSLAPTQQSTVSAARQFVQQFSSNIRSIALGDFKGNSRTDIALLTNDGIVHFSSSSKRATNRSPAVREAKKLDPN